MQCKQWCTILTNPKMILIRFLCLLILINLPLFLHQGSSPYPETQLQDNSPVLPSLIFPFHLLHSPVHHTGFAFYIFPCSLAMFFLVVIYQQHAEYGMANSSSKQKQNNWKVFIIQPITRFVN